MVNWQRAYRALSRAGFTDAQIGELAGISRNTINRVRNGTYPHDKHDPGFDGGKRVLDTLTDCVRQGVFDHDPMAETDDNAHADHN